MTLRALRVLLSEFPAVGRLTFGDILAVPAYVACFYFWRYERPEINPAWVPERDELPPDEDAAECAYCRCPYYWRRDDGRGWRGTFEPFRCYCPTCAARAKKLEW